MSGIGGPGILDVVRAELQQTQGPTPVPQAPSGGSLLMDIVRSEMQQRPQASAVEQPKPIPLDADTERGVDGFIRAAVGTRLDPVGRISFLEEKFGKGNVFSRTKDASPSDLFVRTWVPVQPTEMETLREVLPPDAFRSGVGGQPEALRFVQVDPTGPDVGDVTDVAADVAQAGPAAVGTVLGAKAGGPVGALIGGAVGDLIGSVGRQGASAALPGDEGLTPEQRAGMVAFDVGSGLAGEGAVRAASAGFDVVRPGNVLRRSLRGTDPAFAAEGRELARETGVNLTAGQVTGGRTALRFEAMLRQDPGAADYMFEHDVKRIQQLGKQVDGILERFGGPVESAAGGARFAGAADSYLKTLNAARQKAGKVLFGRVEQAAGGQSVMPLGETLRTIDNLMNQYRGPLSKRMASSQRITEGLEQLKQALLERIPDEAKANKSLEEVYDMVRVTPTEFQNDLSNFGSAASGTGNIIKDLDTASDRRIAAMLFSSMKRDLDSAADAGELVGEAGKALQQARQGYAKMSGVLERAQSKVVKDALKLAEDGAPDKIAAKLVSSGWSDEQVRHAMRFMDKVDPGAAQQARAMALSEFLGKASSTAALEARGAALSPAKLASVLARNETRVNAIFGPTSSRGRLEQIRKVAGRLGDSAGAGPGNSQTAPMLWMRQVLQNLSLSGAIRPGAALSQVATFMTANRLAKALADADGQRLVLDLLRMGEGKQSAAGVLARVATWNEREDVSLAPPAARAPAPPVEESMRGLPKFPPKFL